MNPPDVPADTTSIQLTRMEGVLNLINHQLGEITHQLGRHENRIGTLELSVQRLGDAAAADKLTVEQTAKALKDAKEAADATARAELQKSEQSWSPVTRILGVTVVFLAILSFYFALKPGG